MMKRFRPDDRALLDQIERRDRPALEVLYDRYASVVYSMALGVLRDPALAEEVLSDLFIEIWRDPRGILQDANNLCSSLTLAARRRALAITLREPQETTPVAVPNPTARGASNLSREQACAVVDAMPLERRTMLERAFFRSAAAFAGAKANTLEVESNPLLGAAVSQLADSGIEVIDLKSDASFARRKVRGRDVVSHIEGMDRLAQGMLEHPASVLQELVTAAVHQCGADSAGISVEQKDSTDDNYYHWVATAGQYSGFLDAKLPRYPSACGVTLERGRPQRFRVKQSFFDRLQIVAPTVTDGLLFPWQVEETRGTIWIMAHGREEAFDAEDCKVMESLAKFAATGVQFHHQQKLRMEQAKAEAESAMANQLAHQINNPLQGLMQTVFLFGCGGEESRAFAQQAMRDLLGLSDLVQRFLSVPE